MALATFLASSSDWAPCTSTSISLVAPSPSCAICFAKDSQVFVKSSVNFPQSSCSGVNGLFSANPFAITNTISFVDVSPSTVIQLNVLLITSLRRECKWTVSMLDRKSTRLNTSHVAISYTAFCLKQKKIQKRRELKYKPTQQ